MNSEPHSEESNIMTVDHPRWDGFCANLFHALGEDVPGFCKHDQSLCQCVLTSMEVDVDASLVYFDLNGGFCDCEVLLNVDGPQ